MAALRPRDRIEDVVDLAAPVDRVWRALTKHLGVLMDAGLVRRERVGRETRFAARPQSLNAARAHLDAVAAQWEAALGRLAAHLDGG